MPKLPAKTNGFLLRFLAKPHLVEFLLIIMVLLLIPTFDTLVHTLLFRCFKIYFSMENFHIEEEPLKKIFECNNYPVNIIDQCIKKFLDKLYVPKQIVPTVPKKGLIVVLPILGKFSLNLRKGLYKFVSKILPKYNTKLFLSLKIN